MVDSIKKLKSPKVCTKLDKANQFYTTGLRYEKGEGVETSWDLAIHYYQLAADQGDLKACEKLFNCYLFGRGVDQSHEKALPYLKMLAAKGYPLYQYNLGIYFQKGLGGLEQFQQAAFHYYQLAAEQGYAKAQHNLVVMYAAQSKPKAFAYFKLAAEQGYAKAQHNLAVMYAAQSKPKAFAYFKLAADQGLADSQYMIGLYLSKGLGGANQSHEEAFKYYKLAAEQGHMKAQHNIGAMYATGQGTPQSFEKAVYFFKLAAEQGFAMAQYELARCYHTGKGVEKSLTEAFKYYQLAAGQGDVRACKKLFNSYFFGHEVEQSDEKALPYLKVLAAKGEPFYQCQLGLYFSKGLGGVPQSDEKALYYYTLAAEQGYAEALYHLGTMYANGKGAPQSFEKAVAYFKMAAEKGYRAAQYDLARCYHEGRGVEQSLTEAVKYYKLAANQRQPKFDDKINQVYAKIFAELKVFAAKDEAAYQYRVGNGFRRGLGGVKQSDEEAFKYYTLAAEQGHVGALQELGVMYANGQGVEQSLKKAADCFRLAVEKERQLTQYKLDANQGDPIAQYHLARCYHAGEGTKKLLAQAFKYYKLAADQGQKEAQYELAELLRKGGRGIKESWHDALHYYQMAANQGHMPAIWFLFNCYHYGQCLAPSHEEALKYLQLGVHFNDAKCQFFLGQYYGNGWGNLPYSPEKAIEYTLLAADQGYPAALAAAKELRRRLHPHAQEVHLLPYLEDQQLSTLETILKGYDYQPIFLEITSHTWQEAQVICEAMIENPRLTFICPPSALSTLLLAFELRGYKEESVNYGGAIKPSTQQVVQACVFVGHDLSDHLLKPSKEDLGN